jgi:hypothetical protein
VLLRLVAPQGELRSGSLLLSFTVVATCCEFRRGQSLMPASAALAKFSVLFPIVPFGCRTDSSELDKVADR